MKKIFVLLSLTMLLYASTQAQVQTRGFTTMYGGTPTAEAPVLAIGIATADAAYGSGSMPGELLPASQLQVSQTKNLSIDEVFDTSGAHFYVYGAPGMQPAQFEYRVMQNASTVVVPWTTVGHLMQDADKAIPKAYLGHFKTARGNHLLVDLRRKGADASVAMAIVYFRKTQPTLSNIFLGDEMKRFMKKLTNPDRNTDTLELRKWRKDYTANELDTTTGLPKKLVLGPDQNTVIFYLKQQVNKAELLEYQLLRDGQVVTDWKPNEFDNGFVWLTNMPPGNYQLKMRFAIQRENVTSYPFTIRPRWDQTLTFKFLTGGLIAAFFGFLLLLYRLRQQRQKLRQTKAERDKAETELRSIYAQLNPHFIFNALSSIQGLVNRNENDKASHYLSTFSKLLRESLVNNEKDRVPLAKEIQVLDTYLQLEQLRFHFHYTINVAESIPVEWVEVPSLLLQPLVENAIKHGVSSLYDKGEIEIRFSGEEKDLIASIADNGKGFDPSSGTNGFGLKLTRERIRLLNEGDQEHEVTMAIHASKEKGTIIVVRFKNWL